MAAKRGSKQSGTFEIVSAEDKIARLLGLLVVKDIESAIEKVAKLRSVGFQVAEIALMLGISENAVAVASYQARKAKGKKAK